MRQTRNPKYIISSYGRDTIRKIASAIYESPDCRYSSNDIATNLFVACLKGKSIEYVSRAPIGDTVLWRIKKEIGLAAIKDLIDLQKPAKGSHLTILLDGHDVMFYGKVTNGIVGTKPKDGSHRAFKYLAAYTTSEPHSIVDVMPLFDGSTTDPAISLIGCLMKDYVIDMVIMDGEFYLAELIDFLSRNGIEFTCRRTNTNNIRELNVLYDEPYRYETKVKRGEGNEINLSYWLYRCKGIGGDFYLVSSIKTAPKKLRMLYKTRWNIETGFRDVNGVKAKTTTRDMFVRLFLYVVSCIIYNLWMKTRFKFNLLTIRMYDFVESLIDSAKMWLLGCMDIGNRIRD
jgi:hypothetical protein